MFLSPLLCCGGNTQLLDNLVYVMLIYCHVVIVLLVCSTCVCCNPVNAARLYTQFVDCRLVDSRFIYTLNTKTSYSWLTKPKTPKLNAKTGGSAPRTPLNCLWLAISN